MPYVKEETVITVNTHLGDGALEKVGRLLGRSLRRNKDHADKYVLTLPRGQSRDPLLAYLRSISAPHAVAYSRRWPGAAVDSQAAAEPVPVESAGDKNRFSGHFHKSIVRILRDNGESFLADHDVDETVCRQVADEILENLLKCNIRVLVAVRGGCVQGALADLPNIALEVHDFDVFETEALDDQGRTKQQADADWDMSRSRMHAIY